MKKKKLVLKFWIVETIGYTIIVTGMWLMLWLALAK